ncbi:D-xylose 1-dehydrogenase Gfo6 [Saliphagus infecundisoli]|uniref:D-xylose 1-dehydrogenase Gfo6 n=1 Tax=Saliphagus infecundisoli TaxID=1849069 RepID=A0ABD5QDY3_9EURY|nr:D-xylose 1-dehydrogenase Gfo6 [Saliphagus infecundisoli]
MDLATGIGDFSRRDWQRIEDGELRFALIGLGWWTVDVAIPAIEESDLCATAVLVSSSTEKAERIAAENGVETGISYEEFHDGEAAEEYDAVYVGTPNALHLEYVETAAEYGKAVLCEKPLEATVERAEKLVEAAEGEVPLMTAYRMQTEPAVRRARELIEAGFVGEPVSVRSTNTQPLLEMIPDPDQWRLNPDLAGYGASVMDLGIYSINTARYLLDREPVLARATMRSDDEAFADVPDEVAEFTLTFEGEVPLEATASQNAQEGTSLTLIGTEGSIELDPAFHGEATLHVSKGDVRAEIEDTGIDATGEMREEFDYFADRVLSGGDIGPDGHEGLADMRAIRAIHNAADRDGTVDI